MARVDKKPCYLGYTKLHLIATSQIVALRGDEVIKKWVKEGNPCRSLFLDWGEETEASRAAGSSLRITMTQMKCIPGSYATERCMLHYAGTQMCMT